MKDKRTYTKLKEHGEDMSDENQRKHKNDYSGALDLSYLIEQHKAEIWEYKQKEADWSKTKNVLDGSKQIIDQLSSKLVEQVRIIAELRYDNQTYKKEIEKLVAEKNK